ncbi:Polysaccharide pyruvyl transferase [compost metagenome]
MRILHAYCLNYNIGDYALGIGVKNLLREYLPVDLIAETNLQGTVFNEYFIEQVVNKNYDLLVVGGGGVIHGAHWPNGWFWMIKEDLISRINIPFIVYGVGYNYFKDEGGIPEIGRSHLKETLRRAAYFSIRNDGSVSRFAEQIGVTVPEIPDPGFHINLKKEYSCNESSPFVLIQLANDKPEHRFGSLERRARFVSEMRAVTSHLSGKYKVIFAPHVYEDISLSKEVSMGIENTEVWDFSRYAFDNCAESLGLYQSAEFVLAMRGHGQIVPIAFNTPVISLENHPKHSGLMQKLGLGEYNVSLEAADFIGELLGKVAALEAGKADYIEKLHSINNGLLADSAKAFEVIRRNLGARALLS